MKEGPLTPSARAAARAALLDHYDREARDLPWRSDTDPYRVLVSEIMLQQTRVETVKDYYGAWLERFPSLAAVADADEDEILKAWEGLGYYRRARDLHRAARVVREEHGGVLPRRIEDLRGLPGVGEYTSGAVASIAFGQAVPAVDGNVRRVLARLHDVAEPSARWLRTTGAAWVDERRPGDWNQALMELGATVCTPRSPRCDACPLASWCRALAGGTVEERPAVAPKRPVPSAEIALAILHAEGRVLVEKRPAEGLLAGMWAFPERRLEGEGESEAAEAARSIAVTLGLGPIGAPTSLPDIRHRFSHLEARYLPVLLDVERAATPAPPRVARWIAPEDDEVALPVAQRKALEAWVAAQPVTTAPETRERLEGCSR
jgi:A/G-specific adenine glycosylase